VRPAKDKAIVELPLDRDAEECLPNSEYSLPPRPTLVSFRLGGRVPQATGVAKDPAGNSRCMMGARLKVAAVTGASQGIMSCQ